MIENGIWSQNYSRAEGEYNTSVVLLMDDMITYPHKTGTIMNEGLSLILASFIYIPAVEVNGPQLGFQNWLYVLTALVTRQHWIDGDRQVTDLHFVWTHILMTGGQTAVSPFICSAFTEMSMLAAVKIACLWVVYLCLHNTEVNDSAAWFRSAQAQKVHRVHHRGRKQHIKSQKAEKLVLSKGLILLCESSFHVVSDRCMCEHLL